MCTEMMRFVRQQNVERFRQLLTEVNEPARRRTLQRLLMKEQALLRKSPKAAEDQETFREQHAAPGPDGNTQEAFARADAEPTSAARGHGDAPHRGAAGALC